MKNNIKFKSFEIKGKNVKEYVKSLGITRIPCLLIKNGNKRGIVEGVENIDKFILKNTLVEEDYPSVRPVKKKPINKPKSSPTKSMDSLEYSLEQAKEQEEEEEQEEEQEEEEEEEEQEEEEEDEESLEI
jgi:hypothetical protein